MSVLRPVGFGIVGAGVAAAMHRDAIRANAAAGARLAGVAVRDASRHDAVAAAFGAPALTFDALLRRNDVDVVCLCTPSGDHAPQALAALAAGKHVLVEKPMALRVADADAMIAAAHAAGLLLGVALQRRALPLFQDVHRAIAAGDLGTLTLGLVSIPYLRTDAYYGQAPWRGTWAMDGGGVLMNQGVHLLDLLLWYMGDPMEILATAAANHRAVEVEDTLAAVIRFAGSAMATVTATTVAPPGFAHRLEVYGTRGGVQFEGEQAVRWRLAAPAAATVAPRESCGGADAAGAADPKQTPLAGHVRLIANFMAALRQEEPLVADGREGRRGLAAVRAIYAAAGIGPLA